MKRYNFEILQGKTTSAIERNVPIADAKGLWLRIGAIASLPKSRRNYQGQRRKAVSSP
jgi:hypothetical protein